MSAAQFNLQPQDNDPRDLETEPFALKEQVAERLAAHRARRGQSSSRAVTPIASSAPAKDRTARIAQAVAERYSQSPSYRSYLAAEAERAIRQAEAAAEVAVLNAKAIANAQYELLAELDQWSLTAPPAPSEELPPAHTIAAQQIAPQPPPTPAAEIAPPALTVRLDVPLAPIDPTAAHRIEPSILFDEEESQALDDEIAFRHSPVFESFEPPVDIPANLIEFPRQLVAPRKARPRLAEGPLREDDAPTPQTAQLRIFEVEATQISTSPVVESVEPEWSSIMLGATPAAIPAQPSQTVAEPFFNPILPLQTAAISLRVMAAVVDACIISASLLAFVATAAITFHKISGPQSTTSATTPMPLPLATVTIAVALAVLATLYHLLFFTFSDTTPGMRYARIGLCTFSDDNPTRSAMRRRLFAVALAACPLGIGFFWALLDDDKLGWHDRISRMYQRAY